jgi:hypothetical protein
MIGARGIEKAASELGAVLRTGADRNAWEPLARACELEFDRLAESQSAA